MYIEPVKIFREKICRCFHCFIINKCIVANCKKPLQQPIICGSLYAFIFKSDLGNIIIASILVAKYIKLLKKNVVQTRSFAKNTLGCFINMFFFVNKTCRQSPTV